MNTEALASLNDIDPNYPVPQVWDFLSRPENHLFLDYVYRDPFGCHVFPGDIEAYPLASFFADMEREISEARQIHLWAYIPTCRYRCHFCQYPTVILNPKAASSQEVFRDLVDYNIKEATMWLEKVPSLAQAEIGEFNIFGGTPSLLPEPELRAADGLLLCALQLFSRHPAFRRRAGHAEPGVYRRTQGARLQQNQFRHAVV